MAMTKERKMLLQVSERLAALEALLHSPLKPIRAGYLSVQNVVLTYAMGKGEFTVDDLLGDVTLERTSRSSVMSNLRHMTAVHLLREVKPGRNGRGGYPATYALDNERK